MKFYNLFTTTLIYIYAFYIIYRPNLSVWVGNISILYLLTVIIYLLLFFRHRSKIIKVFNNRYIGSLTLFVIISLIYLLIFSLILNQTFNSYGVRVLINILFIVFPNVLFISLELLNKNYSLQDFIQFILNIGLIQSFIAIIMFFSPELRSIAMESYLASAQSKTEAIFNYRIYGFSSDYTFSMQLFQGFLIGIAFICTVFISKKFILYIPFFVISSIFNGRSGVIISLISILIVFILIFIKKRNFKSMVLTIIIPLISIILFQMIMKFTQLFSKSTYGWINRLIYETEQFLKGNLVGTYRALFDDMLFFPKGVELIVGTGERVFGSNIANLQSDIGYVNDIFIGGILFLVIFYVPFFWFLLAKHNTDYFNFAISLFSIIFILISNYKGEILRPNVLIYGILLMKFYSILVSNKYLSFKIKKTVD